MLALGIHGGLHEVQVAHAGDFHGVLKCQEQAFACPVARVELEEVRAVEVDRAGRHFVVFTAGEDRRQGRLSGAVGAHDGVHLTGTDLEVQSLEDGGVFHACVEVVNGQH